MQTFPTITSPQEQWCACLLPNAPNWPNCGSPRCTHQLLQGVRHVNQAALSFHLSVDVVQPAVTH